LRERLDRYRERLDRYTDPGAVEAMGCLLVLVLAGAVLLVGAGFALHLLWVFAAIFFLFWVAGYGFGRGRRRASRSRTR